jgi:hypothetical protein
MLKSGQSSIETLEHALKESEKRDINKMRFTIIISDKKLWIY